MAKMNAEAGLPRNTFHVIVRMLTIANFEVMSTLRALADEENLSRQPRTDAGGERMEATFRKVKRSANAADAQMRSSTSKLGALRKDLNSLKGLYPPKLRRLRAG